MSNFSVKLTEDQRNVVRALVRTHSGFEAFRVADGDWDSRAINKDQLMRAIVALGLEQQVMAIVNAPVPLPSMVAEAVEINKAEDDRIEAMIAASLSSADGMAVQGVMELNADDMTASVLDPLRPFLSPTIIGTVATALAPIVAAAVKPAVVRETVRTVTVDENGEPVFALPEPPQAKHIGDTTLGKLFGLKRFKHSDKPVRLYDCVDSPAVDPFYVVEPMLMAKLVTAAERGRNVWLGGPKGSGKTSMPTQYAARARRPFVRVAFDRNMEKVDLIGQLVPDGKAGIWKWRDGLLLRAIRTPGMVILLDEITATPPGMTLIIQTLVDHRYIELPTGERVHCAADVCFVCADNTFGFGDSTGLYAGTMVANGALIDRQARMLRVDYLSPALEAQALANHTGAPKPACERVVNFTAQSRKLSGLEDRPTSLRQMIAFVEMVFLDGFGVKDSFEDTHLTRLPDAERATLKVFFDSNFDCSAFESELTGTAAQAAAPAQSDLPEQIASRNAFEIVDLNNS